MRNYFSMLFKAVKHKDILFSYFRDNGLAQYSFIFVLGKCAI